MAVALKRYIFEPHLVQIFKLIEFKCQTFIIFPNLSPGFMVCKNWNQDCLCFDDCKMQKYVFEMKYCYCLLSCGFFTRFARRLDDKVLWKSCQIFALKCIIIDENMFGAKVKILSLTQSQVWNIVPSIITQWKRFPLWRSFLNLKCILEEWS